MNKKILGVITARGGSKGVPGKNIKLLGGKPLISYTINSAKKSAMINDLIVSTDDTEIAKICEEYGADVPFIRPKELAKDDTPHLPVMQHAIDFMEKKLGTLYDIVVIFQPTSPFRTTEDIEGTIQKLIDTGADSAVSICEVSSNEHPMKMKKLDGDKLLPYVVKENSTQRQNLPTVYKRSCAVYAMYRDKIMSSKNPEDLHGKQIVGHIVPTDRSVDIDSATDWAVAEYKLEDLKNKGFTFI